MMMERRRARIKKIFLKQHRSLKSFWNHRLTDTRKARGKRWSNASLLNTLILGLAMRILTLRELERVTEEIGIVGGSLDISRRISDTTLYLTMTRILWMELREALYLQVKRLFRSKTIQNDAPHIAGTAHVPSPVPPSTEKPSSAAPPQ